MAGRFRRARGLIEARFEPSESALLAELFTSLEKLLRSAGEPGAQSDDPLERLFGSPAQVETEHDPVLTRLFPDAYADPDASAEFRRLTGSQLQAEKLAHVETVLEQLHRGGRVSLQPEQAQAWLAAWNDLRLALGTRLGVTEESPEELDRRALADPAASALRVYEWLGYLQETLVRCLDR